MNSVATLDPVDELRAQVRGEVVNETDAGPGEVREVFNLMHPSSAEVVVRCTGTADVVAGVSHARERGLPIAVRGGGHSIAGLSSIAGGVLLDLGPMRGVQVDPERRLATVQGGAVWGDVDRETQAFGLVAPGGVVSDTGVGGLTLGGGYGWVRRKYGLSVDALVEAQVVGADGEVRTACADSHPDLFWAIRGRRRQLRSRHLLHVRAPAARTERRLLGDLLSGRGDRRRPARLAGVHGRCARRGQLGRGDAHLPREPGDARSDP